METEANELSVQSELRRGKKKRKVKRAFFIASFISVPIIQFLIFYVYINICSFPLAFQRKNTFLNTVEWVGWDNFKKVVELVVSNGEMGLLGRAILNSIMYFLLNNLIMMPLTIILAYFFWKNMPGARIFRYAFLIPSLIPGSVLPMLYAFMLDSSVGVLTPLMNSLGLSHLVPVNGWLGTYETAQAMIMFYILWSGCGVSIMMMTGNINRLPSDVFESARLDGIKLFQELWYLVIPMILPLLNIMIVMSLSSVLNIYLPPMLITAGGPAGSTKTIGYMIMDWTTQGEESVAAAGGLMFSLITIPLVFTVKYILKKITPEIEY